MSSSSAFGKIEEQLCIFGGEFASIMGGGFHQNTQLRHT
jgi:hypothetical protein